MLVVSNPCIETIRIPVHFELALQRLTRVGKLRHLLKVVQLVQLVIRSLGNVRQVNVIMPIPIPVNTSE